MNTKLQPVLRALHRIFPVSKSPELSPCLLNGDPANDQKYTVLTNEDASEDNATNKEPNHVGERDEPKKERPESKWSSSVKKSAERFKSSFRCCQCSRKRCVDVLKRIFPFITILRNYSLTKDLPCDIIAGLTVGIMHIPQGMAYAMLTQLPPVYGLYTSFLPVLLYFFFGTSKHISVGTFGVVTMMIGTVVDKGHAVWQQAQLQGAILDVSTGHNLTHFLKESGPTLSLSVQANNTGSEYLLQREQFEQLHVIKLGYAMAVTLCVGVLQIFFGATSLGFLTDFLSDPLISGFTTGAAIHVFASQIKSAFGVHLERYSGPFKLIFLCKDFLSKIGQTNVITLLTTVGAMIVLFIVREGINNRKCMKRIFRGVPVPGELILISVGTFLSIHFSLHQEYDVEVIGHIPTGFPSLSVTFVKYLPDVIGESVAICFTAFSFSFAIAKILADKHDYEVDPNKELIAHGLCNVVGSLFSSFCSSASLSRSMVQDGVGGRTQVVSLVSSVAVIIVVLSLGPLFEPLPTSILAGIIIISLKALFLQFREVPRLWRISKIDCSVWLVTFTTTLLMDVDLGLLIGLVYNLIPILLQTQRPKSYLLGKVPDTEVFVNKNVWPEATPVPGIHIFRYDSPLYFANADSFRAALIKETAIDPHILKLEMALKADSSPSLQHHSVSIEADVPGDKGEPTPEQYLPPALETFAIIIEGSSIQSLDSGTVHALTKIVVDYRDCGIEVYFAECRGAVLLTLSQPDIIHFIHTRNVCKTVAQAVEVAQKIASMSSHDNERTHDLRPQDLLDGGWETKGNLGESVELDGKPDVHVEVVNVQKIELRMNNELAKDYHK